MPAAPSERVLSAVMVTGPLGAVTDTPSQERSAPMRVVFVPVTRADHAATSPAPGGTPPDQLKAVVRSFVLLALVIVAPERGRAHARTERVAAIARKGMGRSFDFKTGVP